MGEGHQETVSQESLMTWKRQAEVSPFSVLLLSSTALIPKSRSFPTLLSCTSFLSTLWSSRTHQRASRENRKRGDRNEKAYKRLSLSNTIIQAQPTNRPTNQPTIIPTTQPTTPSTTLAAASIPHRRPILPMQTQLLPAAAPPATEPPHSIPHLATALLPPIPQIIPAAPSTPTTNPPPQASTLTPMAT